MTMTLDEIKNKYPVGTILTYVNTCNYPTREFKVVNYQIYKDGNIFLIVEGPTSISTICVNKDIENSYKVIHRTTPPEIIEFMKKYPTGTTIKYTPDGSKHKINTYGYENVYFFVEDLHMTGRVKPYMPLSDFIKAVREKKIIKLVKKSLDKIKKELLEKYTIKLGDRFIDKETGRKYTLDDHNGPMSPIFIVPDGHYTIEWMDWSLMNERVKSGRYRKLVKKKKECKCNCNIFYKTPNMESWIPLCQCKS